MKTTGKSGKSMLSYAYQFGDSVISNGLLLDSRREGFEILFHASPGEDARIRYIVFYFYQIAFHISSIRIRI